jgi:glycerol kinase
VTIFNLQTLETTALGAAYAAGLAVGYWDDQTELKSKWSVCHKWESGMMEETRAKLFRGWNKAIERTLNWVDEDCKE